MNKSSCLKLFLNLDEKLSKPSRPIFFTETSALSQSTNVDLNPKIVVEEQYKDLPDPNPKDFRVQTEVNIQKAQHPEAESLLFSEFIEQYFSFYDNQQMFSGDLSIKEDVAPKDAAPTDVAPKDAAPTDVTPTDAAPVEVISSFLQSHYFIYDLYHQSEDDKRKKQMLLARMREIDSKEARDEKSPEVMKISAKKEASDLKVKNGLTPECRETSKAIRQRQLVRDIFMTSPDHADSGGVITSYSVESRKSRKNFVGGDVVVRVIIFIFFICRSKIFIKVYHQN